MRVERQVLFWLSAAVVLVLLAPAALAGTIETRSIDSAALGKPIDLYTLTVITTGLLRFENVYEELIS